MWFLIACKTKLIWGYHSNIAYVLQILVNPIHFLLLKLSFFFIPGVCPNKRNIETHFQKPQFVWMPKMDVYTNSQKDFVTTKLMRFKEHKNKYSIDFYNPITNHYKFCIHKLYQYALLINPFLVRIIIIINNNKIYIFISLKKS